ncbi:hypothetical protein HYH03_011922 [Edaphochlamys debaryana]|uniref:DUF4460 domain-containing protein n=1 Tax=Edaphochlamys debaryana TaxID=47281 RepID=A0A836BW11_9CHLO|nr:hypothetical protein HYH03_011922 [Edaphochlamys debaryana]|eukprot:KAG2489643.1 hypothetical protein HYH03_011922 [Edaphochlamys debaryana]
MSLSNDVRRLIRQIIRQVHPDLFAANPYERQCNSDSLQVLNAYVDDLAKGLSPSPARLEFYVREAGALMKREAELPATGSLAPLFYAFGLITAEELQASDPYAAVQDTNFLSWLQETVHEAVRTAEQHELLKWRIRKYRDTLQEKFSLAAVQVGAEYAVSLTEQERQVEALTTLEYGLSSLYQEGMSFEGLSIQLYHPDMCPVESYAYMDEQGEYQMQTSYMKSYIADDGTVHLVADSSTIRDQIKALDLDRARMLAFVADFWLGRVKELTPAVQQLLGVKAVWCDTKTEQNSQKFVIWAGYLLEKREDIHRYLSSRQFAFSLIVHSESDGPLINFHASSPILNVRTDCPPQHLIEFLVSETGTAASDAATEVQSSREREEALLEKVRKAFGLKCIIKICMNDKVLEGAQRLLEHSDLIKTTVNLKGASIALDDCYELWDSGFISVPYNFKINELPNKIKLLQAGQRLPDTSSSNGNGASSPSLVARCTPAPASPSAGAGLSSGPCPLRTAGASSGSGPLSGSSLVRASGLLRRPCTAAAVRRAVPTAAMGLSGRSTASGRTAGARQQRLAA